MDLTSHCCDFPPQFSLHDYPYIENIKELNIDYRAATFEQMSFLWTL